MRSDQDRLENAVAGSGSGEDSPAVTSDASHDDASHDDASHDVEGTDDVEIHDVDDTDDIDDIDDFDDDEPWDLRSQSREHALTLLYEAATRNLSPAEVLAGQIVAPSELTVLLLEGVQAHRERLDALIAERLRGWTMERLAVVDVNVLRLGTFELLERPDVPTAVVIDEAVELAKRYSTEDAARFVNGVLSALAAVHRPSAPATNQSEASPH